MQITLEKLKKLKNNYGEAFYVLDSEQFRHNYAELKGAFSNIYSNFNIAYSYKTNYTPKLCKIVNELGGYAEVVSEMELELALKVGVQPNRIIWNGPIKKTDVMEEFLINGGTVNIDSLEEVRVIKNILERNVNTVLNIGIRCNYDVEDGIISRFGFDVESNDFTEVLNYVKETENINLINLQCHFAKRQVEYWPQRAKGMVDLLDKIGVIPERVDLGGGIFGKMEEELKAQFSAEIPDYNAYAQAAATVFAERFKNGNHKPELLIEPGSALVGDCMKFVCTVKTIKNVRGKMIASVLGSQKNISMAGINPPMKVYSLGKEQKGYRDVEFVGFTCIETDTLYKGYSGMLSVGDMIVISNCGSYSLVMKPPFILPNFPVIDICNMNVETGEGVELIKRRETFDDIFHTFCF